MAWASVKVATVMAGGRSASTDRASLERFAALEEEVGALRRELGEAQERLDFTERLLSQRRPDRLDGGK